MKLAFLAAEFASSLIGLWIVRRNSTTLAWALVIALATLAKLMTGALVADIRFEQAAALSLQEGRFGLTLFMLPVWYQILKSVDENLLLRYAVAYLSLLIALDAVVLSMLFDEGLAALGERTDARFVCSALSPLIVLLVTDVRRHVRNEAAKWLPLIGCALIAAHSVLITTSRIESVLSLGALGFLASLRWRGTRWYASLGAIAAMVYLIPSGSNEGGIAGREFSTAVQLAAQGLPFGFGLATDATIKAALGVSDAFFFSDYGLILYILRNGLMGFTFVAMLLILWLHLSLGIAKLRGATLLLVPVLLYISILPLLDYGVLNGTLLLAAMFYLGNLPLMRRTKMGLDGKN